MAITIEEDAPLPHRFPGVTVKVPPVAATLKISVFNGSVVVADKVVPPPV